LARKAHDGTLFLDEIAELPSIAQPKLLRLVDSGELRSVGSDDFERVSIRFVSATHQDLTAAVASGSFREDLLFRLSTFRLRLPPLRQRRDDLPILIEFFTEEVRQRGYPEFAGLGARVLEQMAMHTWPGNLRELRNVIFRLAGGAAPGRLVTEWKRPEEPPQAAGVLIDRPAVLAAIEDAGGNLTIAARHLGVSRGRLYRDLSRWGIDPAELRG
jgi:DNA-binding NtrC family response regulator